jgi:hypothetical protein
MLVEFNFDRKNLRADAGEIQAYLEQELKKRNYPLPYKIVSVTIMSRWLVVLVEFPTLKNHPPRPVEFLWDALAGLVVLNFDVRYRHFTVHGEGPSLIFK